jgi:hypothetical protein
MLLFFTREAFWSFSIEDRLVGDGELSRWPYTAFSELNRGSRPCQNSLGEELASEALNGDDWKGEESWLKTDFCDPCQRLSESSEPVNVPHTFVTWLKLGEFLLFSVGASSDKGRGKEPPCFMGEDNGVPFWIRNGGTC